MWIRPTSRGWMVMASAFVAFLIALVNASLGVSILAAGCLALAVSSFILAFFSLHRVTVEREPTSDGFMGGPVGLPVKVTNTARGYRQSLLLREDCPFAEGGVLMTLITPLAPLEARSIRRPVTALRRGEYLLDRIILRGGDPAGLFYRERAYSFPQEIVIFPQITIVSDMGLHLRDRVMASAMGQPIGISGQGQDIYGVREYRPTDGMRFIHWKVSARQNRLMVREFEENIVNQISIFLDVNSSYVNSEPDCANFEYQIQVAASITAHLATMYFQFLFSAGDRSTGGQISGPAQSARGEVMRMLANLRPQPLSIVDQLSANLDRIAPSSILYCLTLHEPRGLDETFDALAAKNVDIRWIHAPRSLFVHAQAGSTEEAISRFATRRQSPVVPHIGSPAIGIDRLLSEA